MKTLRAFLFPVLVLSAGLLQAKDLEFKYEPLMEGSLIQFSLQSGLRFYGPSRLQANARMMAELFVLGVKDGAVAKVKLSYGDCATDGTLAGFASDKSPVEGKVYFAERMGDRLRVMDALGEDVSEEERSIVEHDLALLGRPHPIAMMLSGQTLKIGDKLGGKDILRQLIEKRLEPYKIGKVKDIEAALVAQGEYGKEKTAIFAFKAETGESTVAYDSKFDLTGQLVVAYPSGRPVAIRLDGPVSAKVSHEAAKEELRGKDLRGTFSLAVITQTLLAEREKKRCTNDNDWKILVRPDRPNRPSPPNRPRPEPRK